MNVTLQKHCARYIYAVPEGLRELMTDISREAKNVLRNKPDEIYVFIADYLDALMITRENARVAMRLITNITEIAESISNFLQSTGLSREEVEEKIAIIQRAFRSYLQRKYRGIVDECKEEQIIEEIICDIDLPEEQIEQATKIIQEAFREYLAKKAEEVDLVGVIDWREAARATIQLFKRTGVTPEEAHRAATLIKAAYKGYYTRKILSRFKDQTLSESTSTFSLFSSLGGEDLYGIPGEGQEDVIQTIMDEILYRVELICFKLSGSADNIAKEICEELLNFLDDSPSNATSFSLHGEEIVQDQPEAVETIEGINTELETKPSEETTTEVIIEEVELPKTETEATEAPSEVQTEIPAEVPTD